MQLSPKVLAAVLIPLVAALLLWLLTGDKSFLVAVLLTLTGGGTAVAVKPAPGVTQKDVIRLSEQKRGLRP
jgi:hypothetical protein